MTYNAELENCLIAIAHKYAPHIAPADWRAPGDLSQPVYQFVQSLRAQGTLIVIGDKFGHIDESITGPARDCAALYRRLYQCLAARLFPYTYAGAETHATLCLASDFVVLAIHAPAGPIVEAIEHVVAPFVIRNHVPPMPARPALRHIAGHTLRFLKSGQQYAEVVDEIADIIEALCVMDLRPLPFLPAHSLRPPRTLPEFDREANHNGHVAGEQIIGDFDPETGVTLTQDGSALAGPVPHW